MNVSRREDEEAFLGAMQLCLSFVQGKVIKAAFDLGVFETLAKAGPDARLTAIDIAGRNSPMKSSAMLDHVLGYLAAHSILNCTYSSFLDEKGRPWKQYGLTPVSRLLAENQNGQSLAQYLNMVNHKTLTDCCGFLKEAIMEGVEEPFKKNYGSTFYEYTTNNPDFGQVFDKSMIGHSNIVMEKILEEYNGLKQVTELVDVGGGAGISLQMIISKFPHIKGTNFDLHHVVSRGITFPGMQHVGGDMFIKIPSGDAILLKWILHNWDDEKCLVILKNCWSALPTLGKVIVVDDVVPEFPGEDITSQHAYTMSIIMMMWLTGKSRTEKEYKLLAEEAGFSEFKISCKVFSYYVMEFIK